MCGYIIITCSSIVWFLLGLIADLCVVCALVTPRWLIGPSTSPPIAIAIASPPAHNSRLPSVGIYTRCKLLQLDGRYHCGSFDLDGLATDGNIYPAAWKTAMFLMTLGVCLLTLTVAMTLLSCCRQAVCGKSLHDVTACVQVAAGIVIMSGLFAHLFGWGANRVHKLCGADAEPFYPGECSLGYSFYCGVTGMVLAFLCAGIGHYAEASNMRSRVKQRVEEGDRLVCIP